MYNLEFSCLLIEFRKIDIQTPVPNPLGEPP